MIFFNRYFDKNRLKALVLWSLNKSGEKTTIDLVEKLKNLGFHYATQAGLSLSIDDLKIPPNKPKLILEAEIIVESSQKEYEIGNLTIIERFQQMIDVWHRTSEVLKQNVVQNFRSTDILNPVYMMAFSGARGNISQVRQLVGMRGLMADPQGQILDFPIRSNFREGLTLTEYVISCYGARKGLVDTALRTANSGYLTRRLVDVAQHIIVRQLDCGTTRGIIVTDMKDGKKTILSLQKRLVGRVLAENIESIAFKNQDISPSLAATIIKLKKQVLVRSPLTCEAKNSVCQLCYGWSLAHGNLVSLGEAVGILAAQSIGEPGTQLTMRTFHTGGVFSGDVMQEIRSPFEGIIQFSSPLQGNLIRTLHGKIAFLTKIEGEFYVFNKKKIEQPKTFYQIPSSTILFVRDNEEVEEKQLLAEFSSVVTTNNQRIQAKYNLNSEKEGQVYFENVLLVIEIGKEGDIIKTSLKFGSIWILAGKLYESPIRSNLFPKLGDLIDNNSIINESTLTTPYTGFLEVIHSKKQKPFFLSKKIELKNTSSIYTIKNLEIDFLKSLLIGKNKLSNSSKNFLLKNQRNLDNQLQLKQSFNNIFINQIYYKKFGYFISLETRNDITLFYSNQLSPKNQNINKISFQIFEKKNLKPKGIFYSTKLLPKDQEGQYFLIPENFYKISENIEKKIVFPKTISTKLYLKRKKVLICMQNLQGNSKKIKSQNNTIILIQGSQVEKEIKLNIFDKKNIIKKNFSYKQNPYRKVCSQLTNYFEKSSNQNSFEKNILTFSKNTNRARITIDKKYLFKKTSIPYSIASKDFLFRKNSRSNLVLNNQIFLNPTKKLSKKENFCNYKIAAHSGWLILPKRKLNFFHYDKNIIRPGEKKNIFKTDQTFSILQTFEFQNTIVLLRKNKYFTNIRYINNKLSRIDKIHNKKQYLSPNTKNISRNRIYKKNIYLKTDFVFLNKKVKELNYQRKFNKSKILKIFSNTIYGLKFYTINSFSFNKQHLTPLKVPFPNITLEIKTNWIKTKSKLNTPITTILLNFNKNIPLKKIKTEIMFPRNLKISLIGKINISTFFIAKNISYEKLLLTKQKEIFEQNSVSFNSFFSPYKGQITSTKVDGIGKQKSLLLTNKDQRCFKIDQKTSQLKIGQLLRYGDIITSTSAIQESGQIIQIDKNKITLRKAQPILFSSQGVFHVDNGDLVEKNTPLITLFYQKLKTEDIVQGIPKIEELFEARQTKEGETLQENLHTKLHYFFNFYKHQLNSQEAARKSIEKIQQILVNNVQKVYQSQGVTIADKHIEIIVRQMTTKVKITESGRTGLLRGELIDLEWVEVINLGIESQNEMVQQNIEIEKAKYEPILLGITKAALETESFISASSFQETTRILSRAAIERKTDFLRGLKENVILGHLIPAGTGFSLSFDPQFKISKNKTKLSLLSYKDIINIFSK